MQASVGVTLVQSKQQVSNRNMLVQVPEWLNQIIRLLVCIGYNGKGSGYNHAKLLRNIDVIFFPVLRSLLLTQNFSSTPRSLAAPSKVSILLQYPQLLQPYLQLHQPEDELSMLLSCTSNCTCHKTNCNTVPFAWGPSGEMQKA
jgi:hypothetical protein